MIIDVHAHYALRDGQKVVAEIGRQYRFKIRTNERNRDLVTRDGNFGPEHLLLRGDYPTRWVIRRRWRPCGARSGG